MKRSHLIATAYGILILFLIQMTATLVESVYILDLLNAALDEKALGVLFLLSPALLLPFKRHHARWLMGLTCGLLAVTRAVTPYLGTLGRLVASGIGTGGAFILLPLMLASTPNLPEAEEERAPAQGLALAVGLQLVAEEKLYRKIMVSRPIMPLGRDIGYLPGSKDEKLASWMEPIFDNLQFLVDPKLEHSGEKVEYLFDAGIIECRPDCGGRNGHVERLDPGPRVGLEPLANRGQADRVGSDRVNLVPLQRCSNRGTGSGA